MNVAPKITFISLLRWVVRPPGSPQGTPAPENSPTRHGLPLFRRVGNFIATRWGLFWFWLTVSNQCCHCRRYHHRAWIPLPGWRVHGLIIPRVSHGICLPCLEKTSIDDLIFATGKNETVSSRLPQPTRARSVCDPVANPNL